MIAYLRAVWRAYRRRKRPTDPMLQAFRRWDGQ